VHGKVQGVYFRAFTQKKAEELGLAGWVQNTSAGTVKGMVQGQRDKLVQFQHWVCKIGSPQSSITKCDTAMTPIGKPTFDKFSVVEDA